MKVKIIMPLLFFGIIILVSNLPPIRYFLDYIIDEKHYRYSSYDGQFAFIDRSGHTVNDVTGAFNNYQQKNKLKDQKLYRLFYKNPLAFWRWYSYFNHDIRYDFPFMNWNEIEKKRGKIRDHDYCDF